MLVDLSPLLYAVINRPLASVSFMTDACPFGAACCLRTLPRAPRDRRREATITKGHIRDYNVVSQFQFSNPAPNQVLRAAAGVLLAVQRRRDPGLVFTIFSDSATVIAAMKKGRSSSRGLNCILRKMSARGLHRKQKYCIRFVTGTENYADGPSRGLRFPSVP